MNRRLATTDRVPHILIVDDNRTNRDVLVAMLQPEGFVLGTASSGEEALALIARTQPDLILLDVLLPGINGYEVTARIKADITTTNIPIIMITVLDDRQARMRGLNAGAEDFLSKPVDVAELKVRVRNLLNLKAYGDQFDRYSEVLSAEVAARTAELLEQTKAIEKQATTLRHNDERTTFALGAAHMGVWEFDLVSQRIEWSVTMPPLFGLTPDLAPTTTDGFMRLIHPDDRQLLADAFADGRTDAELELRVLWPEGGTHWIAGQARTVCDTGGTPQRLLGVVMDISDRKALEGQLRQAQKMEAVGQLAGGVAHDFNNLLTAILGFAEFVNESLSPDDVRRADMAQILQAGNRAATMTKQLLAFGRLQVLQPTAVDLNGLVSGLQPMLGRLIGEHIAVAAILAPDLAPVRADAGQIEQVILNLVLNARDAMPAGGRLTIESINVTLDESAAIKNGVAKPGRYVMLAVSDTGIGMDETIKQRLFEPFFTTKPPGQGTGLGLAMVYGIVKQSGGHIRVHSTPGKGSTFKVYLPCAGGVVERESPAEVPKAMAVGTETILLIEDEEGVRQLTRRMLEVAGYQVFDAPDAEQGEALFAQHREACRLIVTDVVMPGDSGPKLFERLAQTSPLLKVLYVSGYTNGAIVEQGHLGRSADFLQKPFTSDDLQHKVRALLDL